MRADRAVQMFLALLALLAGEGTGRAACGGCVNSTVVLTCYNSTGNCGFCGDGNYTCLNAGASCNFSDPCAAGLVPLQIGVTMYVITLGTGTYVLSVNGTVVGTIAASGTGLCGSCEIYNTLSECFAGGFPTWNPGSTNTFTVTAPSGLPCVFKVDLAICCGSASCPTPTFVLGTPTLTRTSSGSATLTAPTTATATRSSSHTASVSASGSTTATRTASQTSTVSGTPTATLPATASGSRTFTATPSGSETATASASITAEESATATPTQTAGMTSASSASATAAASETSSGTASSTTTLAASSSATGTPAPTGSATPTQSASATAGAQASETATRTAAPTPSVPGASAYPNPVSRASGERVWIYRLAPGEQVRIYNIRGEVVRRLAAEGSPAGIAWDLRNEGGRIVAAGPYVLRSDSRRLVLAVR